MKQFKACGARNLPSIDYDRNTAWLHLWRWMCSTNGTGLACCAMVEIGTVRVMIVAGGRWYRPN